MAGGAGTGIAAFSLDANARLQRSIPDNFHHTEARKCVQRGRTTIGGVHMDVQLRRFVAFQNPLPSGVATAAVLPSLLHQVQADKVDLSLRFFRSSAHQQSVDG